MSIPVALQQFKSAGVYRLVYDKSTVLNQDSSILRLVVGYSPKGPFNIPVLVNSISEFKALFGEASKTLEKRGVYFHRLALQCLLAGPIVCLNLKKFDGETVGAATIDTSFNPSIEPISEVSLNVEDIYDTTRFWELSAFKLAEIRDAENKSLDGYISLSATNVKDNSVSFFIRKASGQKVAGYNITVSDWYNDDSEEVPEYLQDKLNSKISDFFAEIYFFKGKFTKEQVLTSETLKNYFITNDDDELILRPYVLNAYGEAVDTLDALYADSTSGALSRYVGSLIPYFKDKQNVYQALDILVNNDIDTNNVMMNFNVDMLEDGSATIDLSGRWDVADLNASNVLRSNLTLKDIFTGEAKTTVLGNAAAPVIADKITFSTKIDETASSFNAKRVYGNFYVSAIKLDSEDGFAEATISALENVEDGNVKTVDDFEGKFIFKTQAELETFCGRLGITIASLEDSGKFYGGAYCATVLEGDNLVLPERMFTSITNYYHDPNGERAIIRPKVGDDNNDYDPASAIDAVNEAIEELNKQKANGYPVEDNTYVEAKKVKYFEFFYKTSTILATTNTQITSHSTSLNTNRLDNIYGSSVTFIDAGDYQFDDEADADVILPDGTKAVYYSEDASLIGILAPGDCLLASDDTVVDEKGKGDIDSDLDCVYVQEVGNVYDADNDRVLYYVKISGKPYIFGKDDTEYADEEDNKASGKGYLVRIDAPMNQEIGTMKPIYLEGYTYNNPKPASTSMYDKVQWQDFILSALTDYKGLRTGLLSKADIDYRYVVDTFESFVTSSLKSQLSFLCKEKESAFAFLNFPAVRTFVKCPYTSFTDANGVFDVNFVVKGYNPKKSHSVAFGIPSDDEGASYCAFYTPLKFSDGYIDTLVPSAALVSNLFMEKYRSRQPYYIVAGPNYGAISASGMTGPDYNYSREELNVIEPYGVNCMVYRPGFGTFINANQTAKQTPKSALSSVNVRELVIYLQDEIEKILQSYQWEFNNQTVRNKIKDRADVICTRVMQNGGLQDFLNVMDESNNTADIIDNEMCVLDTHIEPGRGMGKMVHQLTIYRTGMMRASISEA